MQFLETPCICRCLVVQTRPHFRAPLANKGIVRLEHGNQSDKHSHARRSETQHGLARGGAASSDDGRAGRGGCDGRAVAGGRRRGRGDAGRERRDGAAEELALQSWKLGDEAGKRRGNIGRRRGHVGAKERGKVGQGEAARERLEASTDLAR